MTFLSNIKGGVNTRSFSPYIFFEQDRPILSSLHIFWAGQTDPLFLTYFMGVFISPEKPGLFLRFVILFHRTAADPWGHVASWTLVNSYIFVVCSIWCKALFIVVVVYKFCCTISHLSPFFKSCHQIPTAVEVQFILLQNVGINQVFRGL